MVETTEKVKRKGKKIIVSAATGYCDHVGKLLTLKDTGDGYVARFHSCSSLHQDHYATFDYAQAEELYLALREVFENDV